MKSRRRMLKDALAQAQTELTECRMDRTAVHEKLAATQTAQHEAQKQADEARTQAQQDRTTAEHAARERDELMRERDALRAEAVQARGRLSTELERRDEWAAVADRTARERDELQVQLHAESELRALAERARDDLGLGAQQRESQAIEARAARDAAMRQVEQLRAVLDSANLGLKEAEEAIGVLRGELQESEEALAREQARAAEVRQTLADCRQSRGIMQAQRDTILAAAAAHGVLIPTPGALPVENDPGDTLPDTPKRARERAMLRPELLERRVAVSSGEDVPLIACQNTGEHMGHAWWGGPEMRWCDGRNADGSGPYDPAHGVSEPDADPGRLRFEDAAFDAMRDALLAITATEPYDPDAVADKLRWALGMMDSSGQAAPDNPGPQAPEFSDEYMQMSAEESGLADRFLAEHWQGVAERLERIGSLLAAENDVLKDRVAEQEQELLNKSQEANEAESGRDTAREGYSELHSRMVTMMEQRDNLLAENEALNREREDALVALRQVKAERDELRPLAALSDPVAAQSQIADATVRMNRAEAEFANLARERDSLQDALARCQKESEAHDRARLPDEMVEDGALDVAVEKLAEVLGIDLRLSDESPAEVVAQAMDALKAARREAGRLRLVLDIIDERKAQAPVDVERRGEDGA